MLLRQKGTPKRRNWSSSYQEQNKMGTLKSCLLALSPMSLTLTGASLKNNNNKKLLLPFGAGLERKHKLFHRSKGTPSSAVPIYLKLSQLLPPSLSEELQLFTSFSMSIHQVYGRAYYGCSLKWRCWTPLYITRSPPDKHFWDRREILFLYAFLWQRSTSGLETEHELCQISESIYLKCLHGLKKISPWPKEQQLLFLSKQTLSLIYELLKHLQHSNFFFN